MSPESGNGETATTPAHGTTPSTKYGFEITATHREPGQGSTFRVTLPVAGAFAQPSRSQADAAA